MSADGGTEAEAVGNEPKALGEDPATGEQITLRSGRFGPYVQRGDGKEAKRSSLPKGWSPTDVDFDKALSLLSLPREVGLHPETGKMMTAGLGRYGPFVLHDGTYANLDGIEDVLTIGLNRAVTVLAEKQANPGGRGRAAPAALKEIGDHPDGGAITVRDGRYGPYVNWGKINATIPKGMDPQAVTMEEAIALIVERAAKEGSGKTKAKPAAKSASAKKAPAKKPAAKAAKADADDDAADAKPKKAAAKPKATKPKAKPAAKTEKA